MLIDVTQIYGRMRSRGLPRLPRGREGQPSRQRPRRGASAWAAAQPPAAAAVAPAAEDPLDVSDVELAVVTGPALAEAGEVTEGVAVPADFGGARQQQQQQQGSSGGDEAVDTPTTNGNDEEDLDDLDEGPSSAAAAARPPGEAEPTLMRHRTEAVIGSPALYMSSNEVVSKGIRLPESEEDMVVDWALESEEEVHTDRWLLFEVLASGRTRNLALEPRFAARGALPYAAVAAHILHDGAAVEKLNGGMLAAPMPLPLCTGLPVHVIGRFELRRPSRGIQLTALTSHADEAMRVEWNRELFHAVAAAYHSLLSSLPKHLRSIYSDQPEAMYRYWPTRDAVALEELEAVLLTPLYTSAAESTLFLATPRDLEEEDNPKRKLTRLDNGFVLHGGLPTRV